MDKSTLPLVSMDEALTQVLPLTSTMEVGLIADAILWEQLRGTWRTDLGEFINLFVLQSLRACPDASEAPKGSGSWRRKRHYNRRTT